ncbi:hypothetical protein N7541_005861 [Penicillium brevicompactum]|uniref:Uncharacterized protein n=1 Tax=Penicillium brevicompactum TaxID=5074 RepID=A0A9W9R6Y3_PENBR|nr:hypothetical protein N7541_005861 [Penicillium brevicompactum]
MAKRGSLTNPLDVERLIDPVLEPKVELVHTAWKRLGAIFILQTYNKPGKFPPRSGGTRENAFQIMPKKERVNQRY